MGCPVFSRTTDVVTGSLDWWGHQRRLGEAAASRPALLAALGEQDIRALQCANILAVFAHGVV